MVRTTRIVAAIALVTVLGACQPAANTVRNATAPKQPAPAVEPAAAVKPVRAPSTPASTGSPRCDAFAEPIRVAHSVGYRIDCTKPGHGGTAVRPLGGITSFGTKLISIFLDVLPTAPMVEYMLWHEVGHAIGHDHPDTDKLAHCRMDPANRTAIAWPAHWIPAPGDCERLAP